MPQDDSNRRGTPPVPARPPGDGRQDHLAMRVDGMLPVTGPASTDTLAAGGGLPVPGREPESTAHEAADLPTVALTPELIPGAYEPDTATHREPGAIGGRFNGADAPASNEHDLMDDNTLREIRRDGGGGERERRRTRGEGGHHG
jgi:hypothetical protein